MFSAFANTKPYRHAVYLLLPITLALGMFIVLVALCLVSALFSPDISAFLSTRNGVLTFVVVWGLLTAWLVRGIYGGASIWVSLRNFLDEASFALGGKARFTGLFGEYALKTSLTYGSDILYGRSLFNPSWMIGETSDKHMLTIAGSGTGKGASVIIPNLLRREENAIVIDPKGTNAHVTAHWRAYGYNHKVIILDPFNTVDFSILEDGRRNGERILRGQFNPLDRLDPNSLTIVEDIEAIARALIIERENSSANADYFTGTARSLVAGYIAHLITSSDYDRPSLVDLYRIFQRSDAEKDDLHASMIQNPACGGLAARTASDVLRGGGTNAFHSTYSTAVEELKWIASQAMTSTLSATNFDIDHIPAGTGYGNMTLYIVIPPDMLRKHNIFLRLIIGSALNAHIRKPGGDTLFIIDEAAALGYFEEIATAYGLARSYGVTMWTFFQDKGQLDRLYKDQAQTFIGSSRAVQLFGIADKDAEWVARMLGTRGLMDRDEITRTSAVMGLRDPASVTREIGGKAGKQYVLRGGSTPLLLERIAYHQEPQLMERATSDPDHPQANEAARRARRKEMSVVADETEEQQIAFLARKRRAASEEPRHEAKPRAMPVEVSTPNPPTPAPSTEPPAVPDVLSWRHRFEAIFGPNGFHADEREKSQVWEDFEDLLDALPDHKLAALWDRMHGGRFPDYAELLGQKSTQEAAE